MSEKKKSTIIFDPKAKTEKFRRPDHPDFRTAEEHKKAKFTGIRRNEIGLQWEFWILGDLVKVVSFQEVAGDPYALTKAHVDLFAMTPDPQLFKR